MRLTVCRLDPAETTNNVGYEVTATFLDTDGQDEAGSGFRQIIQFLHRADRGFTVGSSGNISVALDDGMLITPTNSGFGFLLILTGVPVYYYYLHARRRSAPAAEEA